MREKAAHAWGRGADGKFLHLLLKLAVNLKIVDQLKTYEITPKTRGPEGGHRKQRAEGSQRRKSSREASPSAAARGS